MRAEQVTQLQAHTAHLFPHAVDALGVFQVYQRERGIDFEMADVEGAHDRELPQPRNDAGRRDLSLRRHQHDPVARHDPERARERLAQHDVVFAGLQCAQFSALHVATEISDGVFQLRNDPAQEYAAHCAAAGE